MRAVGTLIPKGPKRNAPAARSSSDPNTLGESNRGTHNQSIAPSGATRAPVWQSDRNAYSAIGVNGEGAAALCSILAGWGFVSARGLPSVDLVCGRLFLAVVLMTPPMVRATYRGRLVTNRPPPGPTIPSRR